ncbi:Uncharacterised protein [uncultured archaeon]|nr:Uncharacterised protein [uncultured archaeon]
MSSRAITRDFIRKARSRQTGQPSQFAYINVMHEAKMAIIGHFDLPHATKADIKKLTQHLHDASIQVETVFREKPVPPSEVTGLFRDAARLFNKLKRDFAKENVKPKGEVAHVGKHLNRIAKKLDSARSNDLDRITQAVISGYERIYRAYDYHVSRLMGGYNFGIFSTLNKNAHDFFAEIEPADGDKLGQDPRSN